jgi:hypothetical protein
MESNKKHVDISKNNSEKFNEHTALSLYYFFLNCVEEGGYENFKFARDLFAKPNSFLVTEKKDIAIADYFNLEINKS